MAKAPRRLWLLRHATPLIAPGVCYGQLDVTADAVHTQQAAAQLQQHLTQMAFMRFSPLQRCTQLAHHWAATAQRPDARLQEMDFGTWEGQPWAAIDRQALSAWADDLAHYAPGAGESLHQMLARVRAALLDSWYTDSRQGQHDVLWVTHAGVARCVQWLVQHPLLLPTSAQWNMPAPSYGAWIAVDWHDIANALVQTRPQASTEPPNAADCG